MTGPSPADATGLAERAEAALAVPLQHALGAAPLDPADPAAGLVFPVAGLAVTPAGTLHAAALAAIVETAGYLAVAPTLADGQHAVTVTISTEYLRAAPAGARVRVLPTLDRRTRALAFVSVAAHLEIDGADGHAGPLLARSQLVKTIVAG